MPRVEKSKIIRDEIRRRQYLEGSTFSSLGLSFLISKKLIFS